MRKLALLFTFIAMTMISQAQTRLAGIKKLKFEFPGNFFRSADTIHYSYTGTRNSDNGIIQYDTAMHYKIDSATATLIPYRRNIQTFDASNRITSNTLQIWNGSTWINDSRILLSYTGGQLTDSLYQGWVTGLWNDGLRWKFSYKGTLRDTMKFSYNDGIVWSELLKAKYTYTSTSDLDTVFYYGFDPLTGWHFSHYILHTYSGGLLESIFNTSTEPYKYLYHYNSNGNADTMIFQLPPQTGPTSLTNNKRYAYTYNSDNKILTSISDTWFAGGWTRFEQIDSLVQYSYESYEAVLIDNILSKKSLIYPNPAVDQIKVDVTEAVDLSLINLNGIVIRSSKSPTIDCSTIPNGFYYLLITTKNGIEKHSVSVIH